MLSPQSTEESVKTTERLSHQRMTNVKLPEKREDNPYYMFGQKFSARRHVLALSKEYGGQKYRSFSEAASYLNMDRTTLFLIEEGKILPKKEDIPKIAEYLIKAPERVQFWYDLAADTYEKHLLEKPIKHGALKYNAFWETQENDFKKWYCEEFNEDKVGPIISKELKNFREQSTKLFGLDLLPAPTFIIVSELLEQGDDHTYLHEVPDTVIMGESLAAFVGRDPCFASRIPYVANQLFFRKSPKKFADDCLNSMTVDQFNVSFYVILENSNIYAREDDLKTLQSTHEFSSHGIILARALKNALKGEFSPEVHYQNLLMALAMQNMGTQAFYSILMPLLLKNNLATSGARKEDNYKGLTGQVLEMFDIEFHATISGMMAANWGYDDDLVRLIIDHHTQPVQNVTPTCAMLKLINTCVDKKFSFENRTALEEELKKFPQLKISVDVLFKVLKDVKDLVGKVIQQSSTALISKSSEVSKAVSEAKESYARGFKSNAGQVQPGEFLVYKTPSDAELRLTSSFQKAVINDCNLLISKFKSKMTSARKNESLESFGKRMQNLELAKHLLKHNLLEATAQKFCLKPEEVEERLSSI